MQPTALVHEAWLRLVGDTNPNFTGRAQFFGAAAQAMRRILIDKARRKRALRHGGGQQRVDLECVEVAAPGGDDELLAVNDALHKFSAIQAVQAEVVKLRFFMGMPMPPRFDKRGCARTMRAPRSESRGARNEPRLNFPRWPALRCSPR